MEKEGKSKTLSPHIIESLKNYKGMSKLKNEAMSVLVKFLQKEEIEDLREAFVQIDKDNTGMISFKELEECLVEHG